MIKTTAEPLEFRLAPNVEEAGYGAVRFTLNDALEMVKHQILPEDVSVELLNGQLVYRDRFDLVDGVVTLGPRHRYVVCALADLAKEIDSPTRHLSSQFQLEGNEWHVPIADAVVTKGNLQSWKENWPTAADAYCVIEVADSSYERDSREKLKGYARAGIPQYIIINLRNRTAEVYSNPDVANGTYPPAVVLSEQDSLPIRVGESEFFSAQLALLLP